MFCILGFATVVFVLGAYRTNGQYNHKSLTRPTTIAEKLVKGKE